MLMRLAGRMADMHAAVFGQIEEKTATWLPGLLARFAFAAVLLVYYLNSARTKLGDGLSGFFQIQDNAYFQIVPKVVEEYGYDASQVPFFPYDIIVAAGTYVEFILPILIVVGLFTRLSALGLIGFTLVQSYVDITAHGVDDKTVGAWFDNLSGSVIMDQRTLWVFLLLMLVLRGAGSLSLDTVLRRMRG